MPPGTSQPSLARPRSGSGRAINWRRQLEFHVNVTPKKCNLSETAGGGVGGAKNSRNGVSVQARSCGQALDDEELFIIEGSPGAQLRDIRRSAKNAANPRQKNPSSTS